MKTQRILALTLAAATATSMFASFSASAADAVYGDYYGAFKAFADQPVATNQISSSTLLNQIYPGSLVDAVTNNDIEAGVNLSSVIFLSDFEGLKGEDVTNAPSWDEVVSAVASAKADGVATIGEVKEANDYFGDYGNANISTAVGFNNDRSTEASKVVNNFKEFKNIVADLDKGFYEEDEFVGYAVYDETQTNDLYDWMNAVNNGISGATINSTTSFMEWLNYEFDRFFTGDEAMIQPIKGDEDIYEEYLAKVEALNESDYTAINWNTIQNRLENAMDYAEDGKYSQAIDELKDALKVKGIAPKTTELRNALQGLYGTKKDDFTKDLGYAKADVTDANLLGGFIDWSTYKTVLQVGEFDEKGYAYEKADYKLAEWIDFAGVGSTVSDDSDKFVIGAYRKALYTYAAATKASTKNYVSQTAVDEALAELDDALIALDPNYVSSDWATVKMQEALDKAEAVVETDYRTTSSTWKKFVEAKEYVEKLLGADQVKDDVADKAATDLLKMVNDELPKVALSVPSSMKTDLKATVKEAKKLLEDKTGKSAKQIINLQDAVTVAEDKDNKLDLISEYEAAQKALDAAMTGYKQVQGWYQDGGKWYFGKDDAKATGWLQDNGKWYFLNADGSMVANNWVKSDAGYWYWMEGSGAMATSKWIYTGNKWYYMNANGIMATGWNKIDGSWYYLQPSNGAMVSNGWYWIGGKCYYFYGSGKMAANTTIGGYRVDASGAWVK